VSRGIRLEPPTPRRGTILRPRLLDRLRRRFAVPVTLVVAPAGYGKTTLLAQAVRESGPGAPGGGGGPGQVDCWLTCSPDDVAVSSLARGLCEALGVTPPPADRDDAVAAEAASAVLVEAVWHRSPEEVALVLDDVHEVVPGSPGAELLARLVAGLPGNGHVVLSGRQPPPVPLARREVQGEVLRLDRADLLFTGEELGAFAAERRVPPGGLDRCGGWPALTELAVSAPPGVDAVYLWEEVLDGIEPGRRRALALLAHVGPFDDELAAAALGHQAGDGGEVGEVGEGGEVDVAALVADLPLVSTTVVEGGRLLHQLHALWRDHLAGTVPPADVAAAQRRAGLRLAAAGEAAAAVRLLTEAGAWDDLTRVVADTLGAAHPPVPGDVVATWLGRLPDRVAAGPVGRLLTAAGTVQVDPRAACRQLEEAAAAFRRDGSVSGELACMAQVAQAAWWSEQPERLADLATRLFEMEAQGHEAAVPLACLARALIADLLGDCRTELAELDRIPPGSLNRTMQGLADWLRSTAWHHLGRGAEALEAANRALAAASPLHAPVVASARLQALWFLGRIDEVLDELPAVVERTAATGLRDYAALMAAACCTAYAVVGRTADAGAYLERARAAATSPDLPLVDVNLVIAEATLAVASGEEAHAAHLLHRYLDRVPSLGTGLASFPQQRALTLWYVLVPSTRSWWDAADLGPTYAAARDLARALVQVRGGRGEGRGRGRLTPGAPDLPEPGLVRAVLPVPWATELALAHVEAGRPGGWALLEALWPGAQGEVRRRAEDTSAPQCRPARAVLARLPVPPAGRLELKLLGAVELRRDGALVDAPEWRRERVRSLLAHLVLHRPVGRERLSADLWPALDPEA
jgi:LuxR family maltose regulon positive regulatory protein